jgi:uncharacterized protein (TIGR03083 family)
LILESCAHRADAIDCGDLYERTRQELIRLVRHLDTDSLSVRVPATPEWQVRDVVAHLVGITADLNARRFGTGDPDEWTRRQVDERRDRGLDVIIAEWDAEAPRFEAGLRLLGYEIGSHYIADLHAHLQDLRSALGLSPECDDTTVLVSLDFYLGSLDETLRAAEQGAIAVSVDEEHHVAGTGEVRATVRGEPFELLRALSARRSRDQIRKLDWSGDVDEVLELFARYPLPQRDQHD